MSKNYKDSPFGNYYDPYKDIDQQGPTAFKDSFSAPANPKAGPVTQKAPTPIELPDNIFIPQNAQSVDVRRVASVAAATVNAIFMSFICPQGAIAKFTHYSVFSDGTLAANQLFVPQIDGKRVFTYHGDPGVDGLGGYQINLGLGPDLSNANLIQTNLSLNPGETFTWKVTNTNAVAIAMGVRLVGYLDYTMKRVNNRFGG